MMLGHLSTRTRRFIEELLDGKSAKLGGNQIGPISEPERAFLQLASTNLPSLQGVTGGNLLSAVTKLYDELPEFVASVSASEPLPAVNHAWKLGRIRTQSFRGIAPAACRWEYDFQSKSHLFYGPNGCGKSSLLGAICWCLTGRLFRDDCPPSQPEAIPVYSTDPKPKPEGTRPDALTLLGVDGATSSSSEHYFVELELVSSGPPAKTAWVRRHSEHGLASSPDGDSWTPIGELSAVGISDLDVELHVLMPAKVGHLRFGKDNGVLNIFSQLVGLDDLEAIAEIAGRCHAAMVKEANSIEKNALKSCREVLTQVVEQLDHGAPQHVKSLPHYAAAIAITRTVASITAFTQEIEGRLDSAKAQLAADLGITIPDPDTPDAGKKLEQLNLLPGHIDSATTALASPASQLMLASLGRPLQTLESLTKVQERLTAFEKGARERATQRLEWALKEQVSTKSALMLMAAEHYSPGQAECPVCAQEIPSGSEALAELESLQPLTGKPHLKQAIEDLERALVAELDSIVSQQQRQDADSSLGEKLLADWANLKASRFLGLVRPIADQFDAKVAEASAIVPAYVPPNVNPFAAAFAEQFPDAFKDLDRELPKAMSGQRLAEDFATHHEALVKAIAGVLGQEPTSLAGLLLRGKQTNQQIKDLASAQSSAQSMLTNQRKSDALSSQVSLIRERASATEATKALGDSVRQETINVVKAVEPLMKAYYERLYDSEHLVLDMVTTGHAANPHVKDEFNIYLRAGNTRLPASPFANAGRLRAIGLCFVFALQQKTRGTLAIVILDDPALSLDDEHKARLVDHLITPKLADQQVILATHYESFFKCAEPCFRDAERLQLAPRRTVEDAIAFDPSDLLQRVENALALHSTAWRELGVNLRRWAERTLATLSGYCPVPFKIFNDVPGSINKYAALTDVRVATNRRDKIIIALRSPQFERIMHKLAHDEEVVEPDVRDGLAKLKECRQEAETEIARFRELFKHDLLKRAISPRPVLGILTVGAMVPSVDLDVSARAAAASNGVGITWIDPETTRIANFQAALVKEDVLAPIALTGHYLMLDDTENAPDDGDLVAVQTFDDQRFIRRFWRFDGSINLEATNPTTPIVPVVLPADQCEARRIVGVLFEGPKCKRGGIGNEWVVPGDLSKTHFDGVFGIRVDGTSLEPIARDGQVVLAKKVDSLSELSSGELACFDLQDTGAVLKRCYSFGEQWVLCPVNPVEIEEPILVDATSILHVYRLVGVLFEPVVE